MAVDPNDVMLMARTMWGENANATPDEYAAIANVMRNRLLAGGYSAGSSPRLGSGTMASVILAPHQFQAWDNPRAKNYPMNAPLRSPAFQAAYRIAGDVLSGQSEDPTHGAVYYYNPKTPGQKTPDWAKGREGQQIGAHKFYGPLATTTKDEHPDLMQDAPGEPKQGPVQVAGEEVTPSGGDKHADLMEAAPPEPTQMPEQPKTVAESVQQSKEQGQGIADTYRGAFQTLIRQHPQAATAIGTAAALNTGIPLAGAAAVGVNALPLWAQVLGGYLGYQAGIPKEAGSLLDLIRSGIPH